MYKKHITSSPDFYHVTNFFNVDQQNSMLKAESKPFTRLCELDGIPSSEAKGPVIRAARQPAELGKVNGLLRFLKDRRK